jgi:hypothetical protein
VPPAEVHDSSAADFAAGTADAGAYVARTLAGEVTLRPKVAGEFTGDTLPDGWSVTPWSEGGSATIGEGMLALDGARVGCDPLLPSPRSLEFSAVFAARPDQDAGFGTNFDDVPWVMFSTKWGRRLYGRTHLLTVEDKKLPGSWFGEPHRFRIDWNVLDIVFSVDGDPLARLMIPVPGFMRALAGNRRTGKEPLRVEWMRLSPYAPAGCFTSRVLDAGTAVRWHRVGWEGDLPAGTTVALHLRTGDTPHPGGRTWSPWTPVASSGDGLGATSRYVQYEAELTTTDPAWTPVLRRVAIAYEPAGGDSPRS